MIDREKAKILAERLLKSRMRILQNHGFFGLLLMHCVFSIDENIDTAATDGERIFFNLDFSQKLTDSQLDIVLLHEIMHIVLKHCFRGENFDDQYAYNCACDIVINSGIMRELNMADAITLSNFGALMHQTPDGQEGYDYSAEEVYGMLSPRKKVKVGVQSNTGGRSKTSDRQNEKEAATIDDHSKWGSVDPKSFEEKWDSYIYDATIIAEAFQNAQCNGLYSKELQDRILKKLRKPQLDWKTVLNTFVQEEVTDYSWSPPDRRFDETDFFLPDFNEKEQFAKDILFMIDTSRSMSEEQVTTVFSEIKGAIEQFNGRLKGKLGFFLYKVVPPIDFESVDSLLAIKPKGGGGTNFHCVFEYVNEHMKDNPPSCIIMLTDGHAVFPDQSLTKDIPVLWLLNNTHVQPPWGKVARIKEI